ncbi:MAG TPA: hypothetical protein VGS27_00520 [Candidatus Sulfotelmatobacter sp.]|nr:hypothetical protein [Candidatus Sulfotelmatobacter sp.]HEV3481596.1 hypothetical protein [Candidatus Acidoferrales bacterium]
MKDSIGGKNFRPAYKPGNESEFHDERQMQQWISEEFSRKLATKRSIGEIVFGLGIARNPRQSISDLHRTADAGTTVATKRLIGEIIFLLLLQDPMLGARKSAGAMRCFREASAEAQVKASYKRFDWQNFLIPTLTDIRTWDPKREPVSYRRRLCV